MIQTQLHHLKPTPAYVTAHEKQEYEAHWTAYRQLNRCFRWVKLLGSCPGFCFFWEGAVVSESLQLGFSENDLLTLGKESLENVVSFWDFLDLFYIVSLLEEKITHHALTCTHACCYGVPSIGRFFSYINTLLI